MVCSCEYENLIMVVVIALTVGDLSLQCRVLPNKITLSSHAFNSAFWECLMLSILINGVYLRSWCPFLSHGYAMNDLLLSAGVWRKNWCKFPL